LKVCAGCGWWDLDEPPASCGNDDCGLQIRILQRRARLLRHFAEQAAYDPDVAGRLELGGLGTSASLYRSADRIALKIKKLRESARGERLININVELPAAAE
jgi:hypothetical protein